MALSSPTGPIQEEKIELTDRQIEKVERYDFEKIEKLTNEWIGFRGQHITESIRENLLTQSVLEVEALVKYCKNGDFARYFVYINNELNDLYQSIMDAIRDPALRNIKWAQMTSSLLRQDWQLFVSFVHLHEKDLESVAGHIVNVGQRISAVVEEIISIGFSGIKELFIDTFEFIKRYALPTALVTASLAIGGMIISSEQTGFALLFAGSALGALGAYACFTAIEARKEQKNESKFIERVGLRKARDVIENLFLQIEDKKVWEEDNGRTTKPYIYYEREIKKFKKKIDELIITT